MLKRLLAQWYIRILKKLEVFADRIEAHNINEIMHIINSVNVVSPFKLTYQGTSLGYWYDSDTLLFKMIDTGPGQVTPKLWVTVLGMKASGAFFTAQVLKRDFVAGIARFAGPWGDKSFASGQTILEQRLEELSKMAQQEEKSKRIAATPREDIYRYDTLAPYEEAQYRKLWQQVQMDWDAAILEDQERVQATLPIISKPAKKKKPSTREKKKRT